MPLKKGQTETTSFLIGILIMIIILTPIVIYAINASSSKSKMDETLETLVKNTESMKGNEKGSIVGYIEEDYILFSAKKGSTNTDIYYTLICSAIQRGGKPLLTPGYLRWEELRPKECNESDCLCLCELSLWGTSCSSMQCNAYGKDFNLTITSNNCFPGASILGKDEPVTEIYYQRIGNVLGICTSEQCISQGLLNARNVFDEFSKAYSSCKNFKERDCICNSVDFSTMPEAYGIYLSSDGETTKAELAAGLILKNIISASSIFTRDSLALYDSITGSSKEVAKFEFGKDADSDYEEYMHDNKVQLYKTPEGFTSFAAKTGNYGFDSLAEKKMSCIEKERGRLEKTGILDTTVGGGIIYSKVSNGLTAIGRVNKRSIFDKGIAEYRQEWFSTLYETEDINKDGSLKDDIYYVLINSYKTDSTKRKIRDTDYVEILYAESSPKSKLLAEKISDEISGIRGKYFANGVETEMTGPDSEELSYLFDIETITTPVSAGTEDEMVFTTCVGSYSEMKMCKNNDAVEIPAVFIIIADVDGTISNSGFEDAIAAEITEGIEHSIKEAGKVADSGNRVDDWITS